MPWIIVGALGLLLLQNQLQGGQPGQGQGIGRNPLEGAAIEALLGFGAGTLLKRALKSL